MEFLKGIKIEIEEINHVLEIAYLKNYLEKDINPFLNKCIDFKYDVNEKIFVFHILNSNKKINLGMDEFVECYKIYFNV
ncbi:hypothetical protein [Arcobacter aquimarinus]|uniref:Uncharacterized protein n=1 Tax=Arcobacter aquimarinus TaxID=1315211 RepID=A0AAE7B1R2_9BACT|nr:hypothetical protein [Arcobacter aquimarinus]QKE25754.1 hypothetical protein AAQM_0997 [Arcobacter aquimarinus]RXI35189.1 hypothetical protein CP986_07510 [Arcobacter aquimarinus]